MAKKKIKKGTDYSPSYFWNDFTREYVAEINIRLPLKTKKIGGLFMVESQNTDDIDYMSEGETQGEALTNFVHGLALTMHARMRKR